ncbi:MAG TPA: deoxyribodipyrimidine photo-lyase [Rubrobacteraceae bacterium]|nr:deoxyribodipyrimidine photo-lyase [Rubrobacteraceae bacterium]
MKEIQEERIRRLNDRDVREGDYVLYWMQEAQRARCNHALEYAVQRANELRQPLLVVFGLTTDYPESNLRHHAFMLEGLKDAAQALEERGIQLAVRSGSPDEVALGFADNASMIVCDMSYLRLQKRWRERVAKSARCLVVQVETEVVVPVELASDKREHAARTLRPKIREHFDGFLIELEPTGLEKPSLDLETSGLDLSNIGAILDAMEIDRTVAPVSHLYKGGTSEAERILARFIETGIGTYADHRNQPQTDDVSHMSKYLHFGHVSPVYVALEIRGSGGPDEDVDSYLEELVVRRELSMNFCHYTPDYDAYSCLPKWARKTLQEHKDDKREYVYSRAQLESAETHDEYWNAAMKEMVHTGYMHNHMRMYWGKKILEWSNTPQYAYKTTLYLNNKYFVDGRDANSYANVAWVFGQHDRGWKERRVFGKVRYMSAGGLDRKAKPAQYVEKVERLIAEGRAEGP